MINATGAITHSGLKRPLQRSREIGGRQGSYFAGGRQRDESWPGHTIDQGLGRRKHINEVGAGVTLPGHLSLGWLSLGWLLRNPAMWLHKKLNASPYVICARPL